MQSLQYAWILSLSFDSRLSYQHNTGGETCGNLKYQHHQHMLLCSITLHTDKQLNVFALHKHYLESIENIA